MTDMTDNVTSEDQTPNPVVIGNAYKVVFLKVDEHGSFSLVGRAHVLSTKVYDRRTALRYAAFEASAPDVLVALISPVGRCIVVLAGGTWKPVKPTVSLRTKRALKTLMPEDVKVRRRTSRPSASAVAKASLRRRRTSRGRP